MTQPLASNQRWAQTILIVPGSLRKSSSSYKVIHAFKKYISPAYDHAIFEGIGDLPHFNDASEPSETVINWRNQVSAAIAVVFVTPEYAYGVPGSLKNALDWIVGSGNLAGKPTALITAATGGEHAHASLLLTLGALGAPPPPGCELLISFIRSKLDEPGNVRDPQLEVQLQAVADAVTKEIEKVKQ